MQPARSLFAQNKIAVIWDFDKTLIPYDMQRPLFQHYGVDEASFWHESNELPAYYRARGDQLVSEQLYMLHILAYVQAGRFPGLNNALLRELGARLDFYAGLPEFFQTLKDHVAGNAEYRAFDIAVEHYVVSTGLRQMILGSAIAPYLDGVWACEYLEGPAPGPGYLDRADVHDGSPSVEISQISYAIDNTTKTRAVFEINKGTNWHPEIDVNASIAHEDRRVPFENMIYIADGPSDVPVFAVVNQQGGKTFAVYTPGDPGAFQKADDLQRHGRVRSVGPADYTPGSQAYLWLTSAVDEIAQRILATKRTHIQQRVGRPPTHRALRTQPLSKPPLGVPGAPVSSSGHTPSVPQPPASAPSAGQPVATNGHGNGAVQMPIAELVAHDPPLLQLPELISPADAPAPAEDDPQETLLTIISEISADTHQPITKAELRALRQYVAGRVSARSTGPRRSRGPENIRELTRAEVESQLAAIRQRGS